MRSFIMLVASAVMVFTASPGFTTDKVVNSIMIMDPWARPSIGAISNGAAYIGIMNHGKVMDKLVAAKAKIAEKVEIHNHVVENGSMLMVKVEKPIEVPSGKTVTFKPHGLHIMLIGLKKKLKEGDRFPLTLEFEKKGTMTVTVNVRKPSFKTTEHSRHHHH